MVAGLGALSTLLILYRIIHHPSVSIAGLHAGIKIGIWLGLIASAAVTYGGYLAMTEEGTSLGDVREQASGALGNLSGSGPSSPASPPSSPPSATQATTAPATSAPAPTPSAPPAPPSSTAPASGGATPAEPSAPPIPPPAGGESSTGGAQGV